MRLLASDASIIRDLERTQLLQRAFQSDARIAVPDVLYRRELEPHGGEELRVLGLQIESLDSEGVRSAQTYRRRQRLLTVAESFALVLAKDADWTLLSGNQVLQKLAAEEQITCHDVTWLFDQLQGGTDKKCL